MVGWWASAITPTPSCVRREAGGDARFFSAVVSAGVVPAGVVAGAGAVVSAPAAVAVAVVVTGVGTVGGGITMTPK